MVQDPQDLEDVKYLLKHGTRRIRKYKITKHIKKAQAQ